jgi:hypothetical protein
MRRALIGLGVAALTVLALAGPASAAKGQVTQFRARGSLAEAAWSVGPENAGTSFFVQVSQSSQGSELFFDRFSANIDASGTVTSYTDIFADVTSGFTFTIDTAKLDSASVSGPGLPATDCTLNTDFVEIGCSPTTVDVSADWTGQGAIGRQVANSHFKRGAFAFRSHINGTNRNATATGTFTGTFGTDTLTASNVQFADLSNAREATTTICIGAGTC